MGTIRIKYSDIGYFIVSVVILLNSGYYRTTITDSYVPMLLMIGVTGLAFFLAKKKYVGAIIWPGILAVGFFFSILFNFNSNNLLSGGRVFVTMMCGYFLINWLDRAHLFEMFSRLVRYIILIALFFELLLTIAPGLGLPMFNGYYDLILFTGRPGARGHGIFWEPGVYASIVLMTMISHIYFHKKKPDFIQFTIYVLGVFLSQSTAGLLIVFLVLIGYFWKKTNLSESPIASFAFVMIAIVVALGYEKLFMLLNDFAPGIFGKLLSSESGTTLTRTMCPVINMQIFAQKPFFGWGFTSAATEFSKHMGAWIVAQTSTSTQILSAIGITGAVYTFAFIFPFFNKTDYKGVYFVDKVVLSVSMISIVNKEPHIFFLATWMLLFYFYEFGRKRSSGHVEENKHTAIEEKRIC